MKSSRGSELRRVVQQVSHARMHGSYAWLTYLRRWTTLWAYQLTMWCANLSKNYVVITFCLEFSYSNTWWNEWDVCLGGKVTFFNRLVSIDAEKSHERFVSSSVLAYIL